MNYIFMNENHPINKSKEVYDRYILSGTYTELKRNQIISASILYPMQRRTILNSTDRTEDITTEEVRRFDRFKNYTDAQIGELIQTIKAYTNFIFRICCRKKKSGKIIAIDNNNKHLK